METLLDLLSQLPFVGRIIQAPVKEFLSAQKTRLHRKYETNNLLIVTLLLNFAHFRPGASVPEQAAGLLQVALSLIVTAKIIWFVISLINSLAQLSTLSQTLLAIVEKKRSSKLAGLTNKKPHHH